MPEIKHTFLKGKMNKSLDDRLVPEGEYRDAKNIEVTTDVYGGGDIGTVRRIKGNALLSNQSDEFSGNGEVIGSFFDDKNNSIYYFITDNTNHRIYRYKNNTRETLVSGSFLNFNKNNKITGVNVIEDYMFFTDNLNPPRKINITNTPTYTQEHEISVVKLAPHKAPDITATVQTQSNIDVDGEIQAGSFMKEKFMRFSYRFKYTDDTYSVLAPFSSFVFSPIDINTRGNTTDIPLSSGEILSLMGSTEMTWFENKINRVLIEVFTNDGSIGNPITFATQGVKSIDIVCKSSDSPAVYILDTINVDSSFNQNTSYTYKYLSSNPKSTLAENQLVRVYDKAPLKALSQEFVGNRVVYGNYEENIEIPENFILKGGARLRTTATGTTLNSYSLKLNRTYDVGFVLSDDYGRTSPVLNLLNNRVFNPFIDNTFSRKKITVTFESVNISDAMAQVTDLMNKGWKYLTFVVKQDKQEYYNVYTPGFGYINGKTYFSLFGDNINKIPIDVSTYNADTNVNTTNQKTQLSIINTSSFSNVSVAGADITVDATLYEWNNQGQSTIYIDGYTNVFGYSTGSITQTFFGNNYTTGSNAVLPAPDGSTTTFTINSGVVPSGDQPDSGGGVFSTGATSTHNTGVQVYVNGVKKQVVTDFTYNKSNVQITFASGSIPQTGDSIVVFFQYDNIPVTGGDSRSAYSLTEITGTIVTEVLSDTISVIVTGSDYTSISTTKTITTDIPVYGNLEEVKINGISNRTNFSAITDDVLNASEGLFGLYKKENNYLLAEIDGEYGVEYYNTDGNFPVLKYADLGIIELPGFESSIDIYYETPTSVNLYDLYQSMQYSQGFDVNIDIDYYNAITLSVTRYVDGVLSKAIWQENRLRGGYNEPFIDFGVHAYFANPDYKKQTRQSSLIYSGIYNAKTGVNNTNQFPIGENIEKSLDPVYGSIQKLYSEDNDLVVFQQEKVSQIPIDRDIIYTAEGSPQLTSTNTVFGDVIPYAGNFGIGTNPESFAQYAGRKYFVDEPKGAVLRLSRDGITEISNYGMRTYLLQNLVGSSKIYGMWDMKKRQYVLSYQGGSSEETLSFDEGSNGWVSFYDYLPEFGGSLDGDFYTFKQGLLYKHYTGDTFYGAPTNFEASIELVMNQNPSANKNFQTINYEGTNLWNISSIQTDIDTANPIYASDNTKQDTDTQMYLNIFRNFDGKYFANIINNSTEKADEISFGNSISGIKGHFLNVTIKTTDSNSELFSVSTNYNINSY